MIIAGANVIGYGGIMTGLYATWYKDYSHSKFHTFNDLAEWAIFRVLMPAVKQVWNYGDGQAWKEKSVYGSAV